MPVSVAARRPSAPSSPSSRTSVYTSSYTSTTSRYSTLSRSSVSSSLDLNPSRYLSDRLSSSSLSSRPVRHGSHSEDVLSRYSTSRERSTEPRASSSALSDSTSATTRSREGSVSKTRLGLDSSSTSTAAASSRLEARGSAYTGASSTSKLGRPPLHTSLSTAASDDAAAPRSTTSTSTYTRSRTTPPTTTATMTTSTGKPFHSRFLKPKPAPGSEDKAAASSAVALTSTGEKTSSSSDKELCRNEDDRNNNSILNNNNNHNINNGAGGAGDDEEDDNGNEDHHRRPSVALLRQRFDVAAPSPAPSPALNSVNGGGAAPGPQDKDGHQAAGTTSAPLAGGHEDAAAGQQRHQRLSASPGPGAGAAGGSAAAGQASASASAPQSDSDNFESPRLGRRAPPTANGARGSGLNGLRNIGNTCFMNSVIQCLSNTRPLLEYLLKQTYLSEINTTNSSMKGALIKAFAKMIEELWTGEGQVINTSAFKGQIQHFAPRFMGYSQQDAQEFLRYLLEGLHEDVNRVEHRPSTVLPDIDDALSDNQKAEESWRRYLRIDNSSVLDVFVGQLKSTLQCTVCGHCSVTFDPFWDLSLPIPSRTGQLRLHQCLEHFTREEVLDGDEKPTCAKCQTRRKCTKSFSIQKFPKILVLHLKRFSPMERFRGKLSCTVEFPLNGLDLSAYAANPANRGRGCTYNLYGIANHSGTTYSGHYTAYCRHPYTHEWHEYNDSRVSSIASRSIVSSEAYVLFYELSGHTSHL